METPANSKLSQFNVELNALCAKYQYRLQAVLKVGLDSIVTEINAVDVPPAVPAPTAPKTEEAAPALEAPKEPTAPDQPAPATSEQPTEPKA